MKLLLSDDVLRTQPEPLYGPTLYAESVEADSGQHKGKELGSSVRVESQQERKIMSIINPEIEAPRLKHLDYVDGLRGICALYIVLHHLAGASGYLHGGLLWIVGWGGYCVSVFITISGFCLMLPVIQNGMALRGGTKAFLGRRARRILPPYYAALLLSVMAWPLITQGTGSFATMLLRTPPQSLAFHLFLLHNWSEQSKYAFNGPLWSVAVECQIYVAFPLLVYLWGRIKPLLCVSLVAGLTIPASILLGYRGNVHYLLLFTCGMFGADIANNRRHVERVKLCLVPGALCLVIGNVYWPLLGDLSTAVLTTVFLCWGVSGLPSAMRRLFTLRPLREVGLYSYSIYLTHSLPLMFIAGHRSALASWNPLARYTVLALTIVPVVLGLAYVFFITCEKPFMSHRQQKVVEQE